MTPLVLNVLRGKRSYGKPTARSRVKFVMKPGLTLLNLKNS